MSNYKDMVLLVGKMVEKGTPFLIIKYGITFLGIANNVYEIVTIGSKKLRYIPLEREEALVAIRKYELPLLHEVDSRNKIWGDERFKAKFKESKCQI